MSSRCCALQTGWAWEPRGYRGWVRGDGDVQPAFGVGAALDIDVQAQRISLLAAEEQRIARFE